ncbi:MAG: VWA domain-containing protein [Phycisphaerae bacterium]|nr:VWA domain-containing protein [Phycisphaerae bacterium]
MAIAASTALAQTTVGASSRGLASNVLIPQSRHHAFIIPAPPHRHLPPQIQPVQITRVDVVVDIIDQVASTTLDISLKNDAGRRQEAELIIPVPGKAVVRGFTFQGSAKEPTAEILPKEEARRIYNSIVAKTRDPALLEFAGYNLIRSSVFPVEAHGTQKLRLTYEQILETDANRVDYLLPRSESLDYKVPWEITVTLRSKHPLSTVYSASHKLITEKNIGTKHKTITVTVSEANAAEPGPFHLSYLLQTGGISASMLCYPDPALGGGYFLLLAGLPSEMPDDNKNMIKREVTLVVDRSGSMNGEKIEQARQAALQILSGLDDGEFFNIITYQNTVEMFAQKPLVKNRANEKAARDFIKGIKAVGGTNIHDALIETLRQEPTPETLPLVLFLTDGLPTVGKTREIDIRNVAIKANPYNRRVFTFGVGVDVNAPLLEKIADETRATSTFVLPKENVEVKVGQVFKRLAGPILSDSILTITDKKGDPAPGRTTDLLPAKLPDFFAGDQLVLLGKYKGTKPLGFKINGNYLGKTKAFKFAFNFKKATTRNAFIPRLWASRKIAELIDSIRQLGAESDITSKDPRVKELVDEIVRLSTEFGILTEYTSFLAREGTDLTNAPAVMAEGSSNFSRRAMKSRSGMGGVNQSYNMIRQKDQSTLNRNNYFYDAEMNRVAVSNIQQINDRAFYQRNNRWVDSNLVKKDSTATPERTIEFGTDEFYELALKLAKDNRQGTISLRGDILLEVDGKAVLVKSPK